MVDYWLSIAQGKFNCYADLGYPGYLGCPDYPYGCLDYLDYLHLGVANCHRLLVVLADCRTAVGHRNARSGFHERTQMDL